MQIFGLSQKETMELVKWYWDDMPRDHWSIIAAWDDKAREAAREITESIKEFSDKDKKVQLENKWKDWLKENPPPKEVDDIQRYQLSQGKKPIKVEDVKNWSMPTIDVDKVKNKDYEKIIDPKILKFFEDMEDDDE